MIAENPKLYLSFHFFLQSSSLHVVNAGSQARPPRPPSGRIQKRMGAGGRPSSRPSSRGQAKQSTKEGTGNTKLRQLARNRAAQESRRRRE